MLRRTHLPAVVIAALPAAALAHPGHDHAHWSAPAMHLGFALALLAVAGLAAWLLLRRSRRRPETQRARQRAGR